MKRTLKTTMAITTALCCSLLCTAMAYAAGGGSEWGLIPEGYVLFVPSSRATVTVESTPGSGQEPQETPRTSPSDELPAASIPAEDPQPERKAEENGCAYTLEEFAAAHFAEINRIREEHGLSLLESDPILTEMAQERIREYRWGHKRADGSQWYTIFGEYDSDLRAAGENWISSGNDPYSQMEAFMRSEGHSANILNQDAVYVGIGVQWNDEKTAISVVQLFAK